MAYNSGYWEELEGSLRKQLAEALAENAALVAEFQRLADEPPTLEEIAADLDKIEMLEKQLAERDKLIEQMAEAIKFSLIADKVRQTRNVCASDINDACETSKVKRIAALSAAERMKK